MDDLRPHETLEQLEQNHTKTADQSAEIERLKSELALVSERTRALESALARSRKTIDVLLADDLQSSEENATLRETLWKAHQSIHASCTCVVCQEVEQSRGELDGLSLND